MIIAMHIVVKGTIDLLTPAANENNKNEKNVALKSNALYRSYFSKSNSALIDNAEDFEIVMPMYNLLEYSPNYSMISGSVWNYYRNEIVNVNDNDSDDKSLKYKINIVGKTPARPGNEGYANQPAVPTLNFEVTIPLKYLSNVWIFLDLPLINCEIELDLSWTKDCVLIEHHTQWAHHVESTLIRRRCYVDTSKTKFRRIFASFPLTFLM